LPPIPPSRFPQGWSRVIVQFRNASVFFDMPSSTIDKRLADFEDYCASGADPMKLERLRYTANGAIAVAMIAEESMALGSVTREVVATAALWMFVYAEPVALPLVPNMTHENRKLLDWHIQQDGGFVLTCVAGANDAWSFSVSPVALAQHGAAAMPEAGLPPGTSLN
jgi:hypothetical protein